MPKYVSDDESKDPSYVPPKLSPKRRGKEIERLISQKIKSHCCNAALIQQKSNNPVTDLVCESCNKCVQVKSTKYDGTGRKSKLLPVTKVSEEMTCNQPITFYKVIIDEDNLKLSLKIFSPKKTGPNGIKKKKYYRRKGLNRWGTPMIQMIDGTISAKKKLDLGNSWV